jgi:RNA polymerase sigma-70 factor (ECF subfamily)
MLRREHGRHVARAVDTLPITERTALTLRVEQGWSYQDIAAATGDPVSTVRTRVSRARQRLRACFAVQYTPAEVRRQFEHCKSNTFS